MQNSRMKGKGIEKLVMNLIKERPMSVSQLAKELGLRRDFLAGYLESMRERRMLKLVKIGRANVYFPIEGDNER